MFAAIFTGSCFGSIFTVHNMTPFNIEIQANRLDHTGNWVTIAPNSSGSASDGGYLKKVDVKAIINDQEVEVGWQKFDVFGTPNNIEWTLACVVTINPATSTIKAGDVNNTFIVGGETVVYTLSGMAFFILKGSEVPAPSLNSQVTLPNGLPASTPLGLPQGLQLNAPQPQAGKIQ